MLLNNQWVNNKIKEEIKRYLEANENEKTKIQHLWDTGKASKDGNSQHHKSIKKKKAQINNLILHLKELEKEQQTKPKVNRRKEIIKIRAEIIEIESKKMIQEIKESRSWFFKNINKIDKLLTRLIKKKRERTQINKIRNERGEIITDTTEVQRIVRNYYEEMYANKFENLGEMDTFLEKY